MLFLGMATIPVTYTYTVEVRVPFWGLRVSGDVDGPDRSPLSDCWKKDTRWLQLWSAEALCHSRGGAVPGVLEGYCW